MRGGTQFQDTANIIEKIYPKGLSELKASSNSHRPPFMPSEFTRTLFGGSSVSDKNLY